MSFASKTLVPVSKSKTEIERLVTKAGATRFVHGFEFGLATVLFELQGKRVRFQVGIPTLADVNEGERKQSPKVLEARRDQMERSRWRALLLVIKAKLEAIEQGVETFEEAFLAQIVLPNGETFGEWAIPQLQESYEKKKLPPLLLGGHR